MLATKQKLNWLLACVLLCSCTASRPGSAVPTPKKELSMVSLVIEYDESQAPDYAMVWATLIDREGRRCGETADWSGREIPGCSGGGVRGRGFEQEDWEADTAIAVLPESVATRNEPALVGYDFGIWNDRTTPIGLIHEGGCELRLDPVATGPVAMGLVGTGAGFNACEDTTEFWVYAGVPSRWRLSWRMSGDSCIVDIAPLDDKNGAKRSGK